MYNINRFLVPMLLAEPETVIRQDHYRICDSVGPAGRVSVNGFLRFIDKSHWREREGFGVWTIKSAQDGTVPFEGEDHGLKASLGLDSFLWSAMPSLDNPDAAVAGVSWYDAFQFCRWVGGRLPTAEELKLLPVDNSGNVEYEWTCDWFDERRSTIAVVGTSSRARREPQGLNPDMRSGLVGFRAILTGTNAS